MIDVKKMNEEFRARLIAATHGTVGENTLTEKLETIRKAGAEVVMSQLGPEVTNSCDTAHYDVFKYELTKEELENGFVRLDPYKVASIWKLGEKDSSGCLFHMLKTIARFGVKGGNSVERELGSLEATLKRFGQLVREKFKS